MDKAKLDELAREQATSNVEATERRRQELELLAEQRAELQKLLEDRTQKLGQLEEVALTYSPSPNTGHSFAIWVSLADLPDNEQQIFRERDVFARVDVRYASYLPDQYRKREFDHITVSFGVEPEDDDVETGRFRGGYFAEYPPSADRPQRGVKAEVIAVEHYDATQLPVDGQKYPFTKAFSNSTSEENEKVISHVIAQNEQLSSTLEMLAQGMLADYPLSTEANSEG